MKSSANSFTTGAILEGRDGIRSTPPAAGARPASRSMQNRADCLTLALTATLIVRFAMALLAVTFYAGYSNAASAACAPLFDHEFRKLHSSDMARLCAVVGERPALLVNTASHCGYTGQFAGLQKLHEQYGPRGLVVIGFASDDFRQAARDEATAAKICYVNFGVEFTMLAPTAVRGEAANPVFAAIAAQQPAPGWNFNKYLVAADGNVLAHFPASIAPDDARLTAAIEQLLD